MEMRPRPRENGGGEHGSAQKTGIVPREAAIAMSGLAFLRGLLDGDLPAPPFSRTAGIRPLSVDEGRVVFEGVPTEAFYNPMGTVHGGWITILLDTAMACAVHSTLKPGQAFTTLELKTTFVRPTTEESGPLTCDGVVLFAGGRIASAEGRVTDREGRLIAHGTETCLVMRPGSG